MKKPPVKEPTGVLYGAKMICKDCGQHTNSPIVVEARLLSGIFDRDPSSYEMNPGPDNYPRARWEMEWKTLNRWSKVHGRIFKIYFVYCPTCLPGKPRPESAKLLRIINPVKKDI